MSTIDQLKNNLASAVSLFIKAEGFHWNVEGDNFIQLHALFNDVYSAAYDLIDPLGEYIRILGAYSPGSLSRMMSLSDIEDQDKIPKDTLMVQELYDDCEVMIKASKALFDISTSEGQDAIANFAAGNMDTFGKLCWKLRVFNKTRRA